MPSNLLSSGRWCDMGSESLGMGNESGQLLNKYPDFSAGHLLSRYRNAQAVDGGETPKSTRGARKQDHE